MVASGDVLRREGRILIRPQEETPSEEKVLI
jgi:hypothetical protein